MKRPLKTLIIITASALIILGIIYIRTTDNDYSAIYDVRRELSATGNNNRSTTDAIRQPLFPLSKSDYWGFAFATLGLMVAAGGGIGGGGILVPIYCLIMGFSAKQAIPLANITVFGGALANTCLNWNQRHPLADRPLIDWDLILVMEPLTIAGALIGTLLNKVLPEQLLIVFLALLLGYTGYSSLRKARKMYQKETLLLQQIEREKESELTRLANQEEEKNLEHTTEPLLENEDHKHNIENSNEFGLMEEVIDDDLKEILDKERKVPYDKVKVLVIMFIVVLFINLLKGGGSMPSPIGITCGSASFWFANVTIFAWIIIVQVFIRSNLVRECKRKDEVNFKYVEGDIEWSERATIMYPSICMSAGFFAGMFGVGGGIVKGPLMLEMGVHPNVASACSATMILFTSFTATTSYYVFGLLLPDYASICLTIGFLATLSGQLVVSFLMKRLKRNSFIAFSIGFVVTLSAFLMTIQYIATAADGNVEGTPSEKSGGICGRE